MIRLDVLGTLALSRADGTPIRSVLGQPKRFALLVYLASSHPGAKHPRDTLLGLLWPELDQDRARRALRQSLHGLRRSLGPGVLTGKGEELIGVDPERLRCDATAFARALDENRDLEALELYRGDFLEGFHVSGVPEFERWIERRRRELRGAAVRAAWRAVEETEKKGEAESARRMAERAVELAPFDGETVRRFLRLMDRLNQPAAALRAYRAYAARLREELDLEPSAETRTLVGVIRRGHESADRGRFGSDDGEDGSSASPGPMRPSGGPGEDPGLPRTDPAPEQPEARRDISGRSFPLRRIAAVALPALLLLATLAYAGVFDSGANGAPSSDRPIRSVAVLPFADMSPSGDQRWFADGLAEELLDVLTSLEPLEVVGRASSFQFRGVDRDIRMVGDSLGVGAVLEGSLRRTGDRMRITVQLVRTSDGHHLWSETFDRAVTTGAVFALQEEIARSVADALQLELGLEMSGRLTAKAPASLEAYSRFLQARSGMRERTPEGRRRARTLIREALRLDPEFAPSWALSAMLHLREAFWEHQQESPALDASRLHALAAAERALALDPELAEAHSTLGYVLDQRRRWMDARKHHLRATVLDPRDPAAREEFIWHLAASGEWEAALEEARIRQRLDPLYVVANGNLAEMLMYTGRLEEAIEQWRHTIVLAGEDDVHASLVRSLYAKAFALQGRTQRAVSVALDAYRNDRGTSQPRRSYYFSQLAATHALAGDRRAARSLLDSLRIRSGPDARRPSRPLMAYDMARVHAALGSVDSAFVWLERSRPVNWRLLEIARLRGDPWWAPIRDDPRYQRLLADLGVG